MERPVIEPIGLQLTRTARVLSRAFDDALSEVGGSLPVWLVLVSLKTGGHGTQRELADAVGIEPATLTHHLHRMEADGLVQRTRGPENRRVQRVELTGAGETAFARLLGAVTAFDKQLRAGLSKSEVASLGDVLGRLRANAEASKEVTS